MYMKLIFMVAVSSAIGWITNYVAIKMLFRPYKEINLGLFKIQGLIPKRKKEIGASIADIIQNEVVSLTEVLSSLDTSDLANKLELILDQVLEKNLKKEIIKNFPMLKMLINDSILNKIKSVIKDSIMNNMDVILSSIINYVENEVDFKEIIKTNIDNFSLEKLEEVTFSLARDELKHIEAIGAILGALIGFLQFFVSYFI